MGIKIFEPRESLKEKLRNRGLLFDDVDIDKVLVSHNYFDLFNGLETIFLETERPKTYNKIKLNDFINLYQFDKEIRSVLSLCLDSVEEKLKSSISYHFCKHHCTTLNDTMQYTNKEHYMDPKNNVPGTPTYCPYSSAYPFTSYQNNSIFYKFDKFHLFQPKFLTELIDKHDHIKLSFYKDSSYIAPSNVAIYHDNANVPQPDVAVPFWVAIDTLTFGEILKLLNYLKDDVLKDVLNDFNVPLSKRTTFLNMIDFLVCLRNNCSHTTLVNRFRTGTYYKINALLITAFSLNPKNSNSVLKLYDTVKLLSFFADVSALKKPFKSLRRKLILSLGIKRGITTYNKIMERMGAKNYREWFQGVCKTKYYL